MNSSLSIGEIAARMGLKPSAMRYYESEGLLEPAQRRSGRRVYYDESVCERIAVIQLGRRAGFKIAEIRHLLHGFPSDTSAGDRWRELVVGKQREVTRKIEELERMRGLLDDLARCGCPDLAVCGAAVLRDPSASPPGSCGGGAAMADFEREASE